MNKFNALPILLFNILLLECSSLEVKNKMYSMELENTNNDLTNNRRAPKRAAGGFFSTFCEMCFPCCYKPSSNKYEDRIVLSQDFHTKKKPKNTEKYDTYINKQVVIDAEKKALLYETYEVKKVNPKNISFDTFPFFFNNTTPLSLQMPNILAFPHYKGTPFKNLVIAMEMPPNLPTVLHYNERQNQVEKINANINYQNIQKSLFHNIPIDNVSKPITVTIEIDSYNNIIDDIFKIKKSTSSVFITREPIDTSKESFVDGEQITANHYLEYFTKNHFSKANLVETLWMFSLYIRRNMADQILGKYFSVSNTLKNDTKTETIGSSIWVRYIIRNENPIIQVILKPTNTEAMLDSVEKTYYFMSIENTPMSEIKRECNILCYFYPELPVVWCSCCYKATYPCGIICCHQKTCAVGGKENCICSSISNKCDVCGLCCCFTTDNICCYLCGCTPICCATGYYPGKKMSPKECLELSCMWCECCDTGNVLCYV